MFREIAILPDVFRRASYDTAGECSAYMQVLKAGMSLTTSVRNLRTPEWLDLLRSPAGDLSPEGMRLLQTLEKRVALLSARPQAAEAPQDDGSWLLEAEASHQHERPLGGIVTSRAELAAKARDSKMVTDIARLSGVGWWADERSSFEVDKNEAGFGQFLSPLMQRSPWIALLDPYLDPSNKRYRRLIDLLLEIAVNHSAPVVEIHRSEMEGWNGLVAVAEWRDRFTNAWGGELANKQVRVDVFLWPDFHDRHVLSRFVGLHVGDGFDYKNSRMTVSRLDRKTLDDLVSRFSQNAPGLRAKFSVCG